MITGPMVFVMFLACLYGLWLARIVYLYTSDLYLNYEENADEELGGFIALSFLAFLVGFFVLVNWLESN